MTITNRVWDAVAGAHVRWRTGTPDTTGIEYPGPDAFGSTTDYTVERGVLEQAPVDAELHNLDAPVGTVQGLWQFDGDLLDETANSIDLTHAATALYSPGVAPGIQSTYVAGQLLTSTGGASGPIRLLGAMTLEILFRGASFVSDVSGYIVAFDNAGGGTDNNFLYALYMGQTSNELRYFHSDSGEVSRIALTGVSIVPGRWHHLAFTRDSAGTRIRIYVNGVGVSDEVLSAPTFGGANSHITIGTGNGSSRQVFGQWSTLRITDDELSPEHILASARTTLPPSVRP